MGGLFSLGSAGIGAYGAMNAAPLLAASDPSVKQNIRKVGTHHEFNLYEFEYKPEYRDTWGYGRFIGLMADEVEKTRPDAVLWHADGYRMLDYGRLQ